MKFKRTMKWLMPIGCMLALALLPQFSFAATVAYWRFENGMANTAATGNGTILDSSGNNRNGTAINGPLYQANVAGNPVPQTGAANTLSMAFNGVDQRIFVPDNPAFALTHSLTLEAFVYIRPLVGPNFGGQIIFRG